MGCKSCRYSAETYIFTIMILNLHSLAFNTITASGGGNPAWGTEMGQGEGYRFSFEDADEFVTALVYKSVPNPNSRVYCPLGKGGNQASDYEFVLASLFEKVFVNGIKVNGKFLLLVVKKLVGANHVGRKTLKYNPRMTLDGENYNDPCYQSMAKVIGVSSNGSWFVSEINVRNQDELHFTAHVLDANASTTFDNSDDRSKKLQAKLQAFAQDTNNSKLKKFADSIVLDEPLQQIYFGAPGTGKSHKIKEFCRKYEHYRITFHPDTDYASFVGSYKPITVAEPVYHTIETKGVAEALPVVNTESGQPITINKITYKYVFQAFLNAYLASWREQQNENPKPILLVIEEINRGNCAQIFGDIFQLLDRNEEGFSDYPIITDNDLKNEIAHEFKELDIFHSENINAIYGNDIVSKVKNGSHLLLPNNLYIWATMNTSDQSLFPIDSAFKRRWEWKYVKIADSGKSYRIAVNGNEYDWWEFVEAINSHIGTDTDQEDKKLGYFFAKAKKNTEGKYIISADTFLSKVIFFIYNDVYKDFGFDDDIFKDEDGQVLTFANYFDQYGDTVPEKVERFIRNLGVQPLQLTEAEEEAQDEVENEADSTDDGSSNKLTVRFPDGTIIRENTRFESYIKALEKIGLDRVEPIAAEKKYTRRNSALVSTSESPEVLADPVYTYVKSGDYYVVKGTNTKTQKNLLNLVSDRLNLGLIVTVE